MSTADAHPSSAASQAGAAQPVGAGAAASAAQPAWSDAERAALAQALAVRADAQVLADANRPTAWQRAALAAGVRRSGAGD